MSERDGCGGRWARNWFIHDDVIKWNHFPRNWPFVRGIHRSRWWWTKISKPRVTGLCEGNSPVTGEFLAQKTSNAENASIWWRHHEELWITKNSTMQFSSDTINFLRNAHKGHPIPRPRSVTWGLFYEYSLTLIPVWISNHIHNHVWD